MKTCPYCGNQNSDDSQFCTECGKPIPQGRICPHCGACVNDDDAFCTECGKRIDEVSKATFSESTTPKCPHCGASVDDYDVFCQNCGKKIAEEPMPTSTESPHDADASNDDVEVQINETDETEKYNYSVEDETRTWRNKIFYILGAIVIVGVLGTCIWNYYSSSQRAERNIALADSLKRSLQDSIAHVRQMERVEQDSIYKVQQEEKEFLENFYKRLDAFRLWEEKEELVRENVTQKALQTLRDGYEYEDGCDDCLALWMFTFEGGGDLDTLLGRKIERVSDNTFLVTTTVGCSNGNPYKEDSKVRLGIVKAEGSYKINSIEKVYSEEK